MGELFVIFFDVFAGHRRSRQAEFGLGGTDKRIRLLWSSAKLSFGEKARTVSRAPATTQCTS
jgi:hypothetical protein